uniref:Titin n=1 Tax=Oryzias sinensis TaxID=183150 RepID=A0A8C7XXI4_9TELE
VIGGSTPLNVGWLKGDQSLPEVPEHYHSSCENNEHTLEISNVGATDQGLYVCRVSNSVGMAECSMELRVIEKPNFVKPMCPVALVIGAPLHLECQVDEDTGVIVNWTRDGKKIHQSPDCKLRLLLKSSDTPNSCYSQCPSPEPPGFAKRLESVTVWKQGSNVQLQCSVRGSPELRTSWLYNNSVLHAGDRYAISLKDGIAALEIRDVTFSDSGNYSCEVQNNCGYESYQCRSSVFDVPLKPLTVTLGETLNLQCHVSGSPPLTIQWMKDRKELTSGENTIITFVGGTASLELRPVLETDAGDYLCKATNASGSDFCKSKLQNYTAVEKDEVQLVCELSKAIADVKWFKDGKEITPSKNITISTDGKKRILTVRKAEKANIGVYTCDCGSDKTTANINIEGKTYPPWAPGKPVVREIGKTSALLTWTRPEHDGGAKIEGYIIEFQKTGSEEWIHIAEDVPQTEQQLQGLMEKQEYSFRVKAVNKAGESEPSEPSDPTQPVKKPDPPIQVEAHDPTCKSITVTWKAPDYDGGCPIQGYVVEKIEKDGNSYEKVTPSLVPGYSYVVTGLKEETEYQFRVRAENAAGVSEPSRSTPLMKAIFTSSDCSSSDCSLHTTLNSQKVLLSILQEKNPIRKVFK